MKDNYAKVVCRDKAKIMQLKIGRRERKRKIE